MILWRERTMFWFDRYYFLLIVPAMLIALWAQMRVNGAFDRYSRVFSRRGITAAQVARDILDQNGLYNVQVERVPGRLTDHYDPRTNVVRLSDDVYSSTSIASIGVAAHEVGHAVQHSVDYTPLVVRSAIIPITNIGSRLSIPLILLGVIFSAQPLVEIGIIAFSLMVLFQLITLPVEFNASSRAIKTLEADGYLYEDEITGAKQVLSAAALTYVAALITAVAQLLRLILLFGRRDRD
ncbi:MAG: zinc metallopeptidase [Clostridiales bacterium]|nr:zinc metallopeptidase [Clostridiales bacterium]